MNWRKLMTELYELLNIWQKQNTVKLAPLPTATLHQRAVYWKAYRSMCRKTQGRAAKVAWRLFFINETAIAKNKYKVISNDNN